MRLNVEKYELAGLTCVATTAYPNEMHVTRLVSTPTRLRQFNLNFITRNPRKDMLAKSKVGKIK
jgi:hypothetical protein